MKIKTIKKLNLHELINYVWENKLYPCRYINNFNGEVVFNDTGKFMTDESFISPNSYFTVETEEELTEDTGIPGATFVYYDESSREVKPFRYADVTSPSLKHITQLRPGTVALAVFRGKQLIWTKEHGIPESGVLEVD